MDERVEFLISGCPQDIGNSLCLQLLALGIRGILASHQAAIQDLLKRRRTVWGMIVDLDDTAPADGMRIIKEIRANESTRSITVIAFTSASDRGRMLELAEYGVAGFLRKPYDERAIHDTLPQLLKRLDRQNPNRKHFRIRPDPDDLLRIHFRLPAYPHLIAGQIVDISLGGVAMKMHRAPPANVLAAGTSISAIKFALASKRFSPGGVAVGRRDPLLAIRFTSFILKEKINLARYILMNESSSR